MKHRLTPTLAFLALTAAVTQVSAQVLTAHVAGGTVQGVAAGGVGVFKGIPFAAPPVGKNRWRAPQPVEAWSGVKRTDHYARACMQAPTLLQRVGADVGVSEDCLYLDVWTPAKSPGEKLPVMVWIYGGGFVSGTTSDPGTAGDRLAGLGVVVVSVAYRVGAFGFLAHPELSAESGQGSGNYGMLDQIAGLEWVRQNIAAFDPARDGPGGFPIHAGRPARLLDGLADLGVGASAIPARQAQSLRLLLRSSNAGVAERRPSLRRGRLRVSHARYA